MAFTNASKFRVDHHRLPAFEPIGSILTLIGECYRILKELEDRDLTAEIGLRIWKLRLTILSALLQYDHQSLQLRDQVEDINRSIQSIPSLRELMPRLAETIDCLVCNPENPKRIAILELLESLNKAPSAANTIGLVTCVRRRGLPGYDDVLYTDFQKVAPNLIFISSRKDLQTGFFNHVLLPTGGKHCPLKDDLWYGFHTEMLHVVTYQREPVSEPQKPSVPKGISIASQPAHHYLYANEVDDDEYDSLKKKIDAKIWESLRYSARVLPIEDGQTSMNGLQLKARLVLLPNNWTVWLAIDKKELIASKPNSDPDEGGFSYQTVDRLKPDQYVVLRTVGGGDMVREIADESLRLDGKANLRNSAFDWKRELEQVLDTYGVGSVAIILINKGIRISSANYVKIWSTDLVMRPNTIRRFRALIETLVELDSQIAGDSIENYVDRRWKMMSEIIHYHRLAGVKIRHSLMDALRRHLRECEIEDELHIKIQELGAAELSVFRVVGIDDEISVVPYNHIGHIMKDSSQISWLE